MKDYTDFLNAISARSEYLGQQITLIQAERCLIEEAVFKITQQIREKGFIENIYEIRLGILDEALEYHEEAGIPKVEKLDAWQAEYQRKLEALKKGHLAAAKEYFSRFNCLVERGRRIVIDDQVRADLLTKTDALLTSLVNHYGSWSVPFDAESIKVHIKQHSNEYARTKQASECLSAHMGSDADSLPMRQEDLRERILYLRQEQDQWKDNKQALVQHYQQSLAGICERHDVTALNTWLLQFDKNLHPGLLNQTIAMTNGQLPLTYCVDREKPRTTEAQKAQVLFIQLLLQNGAQINELNEEKYSALHRAAYWGNGPVITFLSAQSEININQPGCNARTPLHMATFSGFCDAAGVQLLLTAQANPKAKTEKEQPTPLEVTPVHNAVLRGDLAILTALLEHDPDSFYIGDAQGSGALAYALEKGPLHFPVVEFLLHKGVGLSAQKPWSDNDLRELLTMAKKHYQSSPQAFQKFVLTLKQQCQNMATRGEQEKGSEAPDVKQWRYLCESIENSVVNSNVAVNVPDRNRTKIDCKIM
ncbi:MAG: ankyrin repeat domain-containing protein [Legionellales bacterium]|jgi:hypothetical protein